MKGLAAAGQAVVDEAVKAAESAQSGQKAVPPAEPRKPESSTGS